MADEESKDPLLEWNRLNKENAEQGLVSALYESMALTYPAADKFSIWLLAGTGASGALLVSQIQTILPHLTAKGYKVSMGFLVISAIFGFIAKYKSIRCQTQIEIQLKINELSAGIFAKHNEDRKQIEDYAKQREIEIETEINMSNVISEFAKPFPFWVRWLINLYSKKMEGNRQAGYQPAIKAYFGQLRYTFWQALAFLAFLCSGAWYAQSI